MSSTRDAIGKLAADEGVAPELRDELADVLSRPTGTSSAGYPYLQREAWERFRDRVPHLFRRGLRVYRAVAALRRRADASELANDAVENLSKATRVARQVLFTATITAPTDLWLLRHVLGNFDRLGLTRRLLDGEALYPRSCTAEIDGERVELDGRELYFDLHFLLARGMVEQYDNSFRIAGHPRARTVFRRLRTLDDEVPVPMTPVWRRLFAGDGLDDRHRRAISKICRNLPAEDPLLQNHWIPTLGELQTGYRLVPLVLALHAEEMISSLERGDCVAPEDWSSEDSELATGAMRVLEAAGWLEAEEEGFSVTAIGERGFSRGPGPFGIIEAYAPYMQCGVDLLAGRGDDVWVDRRKNVGASSAANRKTFRQINDNLDRFCEETEFDYTVFIEHAIGRGEATRQRYQRSGDDVIDYFGADLEEAAIDAAREEKRRGNLPPEMTLISDLDIGEPERLLEVLLDHDVDPHGAVMVVGNGFHEIRTDDENRMVEVFETYHDAGILLLFAEANALLVDDLRATAWNTYHAGFTFVHQKSGQNLRPAQSRPKPRLGPELPMAWNECANEAGYIRADAFCGRSRTIYPYTPEHGHNPAISVNHFFVPRNIASKLDLEVAKYGD